VIIIMALFFFNVQTQQKVVALDKDPEVTVDVTAFQWNWKFGYASLGADISPTGSVYEGRDEERHEAAEAASVDPEGMKNANPIHGRSMGDLSYLNYNEIETLGSTEEIPVLVLPTNTPIESVWLRATYPTHSGFQSSCSSAILTLTQRRTSRSVPSRSLKLLKKALS